VLDLESRDRRFESSHPDQKSPFWGLSEKSESCGAKLTLIKVVVLILHEGS
jgi:hypothetical protein